ncbi:TRAP transporter small permease [Saccharospirillum sp.]|uniref:TRAP transporter small permease n=1 Tax=Saccharospirillum sp. TaxID=2033801 RepID=UPI0034A05A14
MNAFYSINNWLYRRAENLMALLLGSMFLLFIVQVFSRYVLNNSISWSNEYISIAWLWSILFGYAFIVSDKQVIRIDMVYGAVGPTTQRIMDGVVHSLCALIFLIALPDAYSYISFMAIERTADMRIPFSWVFSIYLGFSIAVIGRSTGMVWKAITNNKKYLPSE